MKVNLTVTTLTENDGDAVNVIDTNVVLTYAGDGVVNVYDASNSTFIASVSGEPAVELVEKLYKYMNDVIGTL